MYSTELLEKKKKKLSRIAVFTIILTFIAIIMPTNREFSYSMISAAIDFLKIGDSSLIFVFIGLLLCILIFFLFLFSLLAKNVSSKLKLMNIAFILFFPVCFFFGINFLFYIYIILNKPIEARPFEIVMFFAISLLIYLPLLISYIRTKKYFAKERNTEKKVEKESKLVEKAYTAESKKQRTVKTTVTQDKNICIHIEFI